ncbi:cation-translocating P-type ATPase [Coraliomargarita parva]|uniref:cation-translocating P-type ATPase n=1 Tax=Coraliomargarita parva TaxID=3014050 RepID=UPI0022B58041|nr:cation-translocating P-type ATPase [Coraliomargarita parva]
MSTEAQQQQNWTLGLAAFLQANAEVEALRVDATRHTVEIATMGEVDIDLLRNRLAETIEQIEAGQAVDASVGIEVHTEENGEIKLQKPTCLTAPRFWTWRKIEWPTEHPEEEEHEDWRVLGVLAGACAVLGLTGWGLGHFATVPVWVPVVFFIGAMLAGGWDAIGDVKEGLPKGELDIHFLMLAVAVGAACIGAWAEGALLLFLFSFSGALEEFAMHRTRREIDSLFESAPKRAIIVDAQGDEREVPVEEVKVGMRVRVKPGQQFPVDAVVLEGKTAADESNLTGEANPVSKMRGDEVFSGTLNLWGAVEARASRPVGESALNKVIRLIKEAQHLKAPSQRFTDRFGTGYTIGILSLTALMFFVWWLVLGIRPFANTEAGYSSFYRAMTLLVVASPCALVLSIPSAILAAIAWGARHGVLFRGGAAIEKLAEVDMVALDKTGTLTTGEMEVDRVESFPPGREREAAELAYSLESHGSHPIGRAIKKYGQAQGLAKHEIDDFQAMSGKGVQGREGDALCVLGRRELLEEGPLAEWIREVPEPEPEFAENWIIKDDLIGRILLKDQIRQESKPILGRLQARGLRSVMLTGDRRGSAESVGRAIGISEVRAGLKPEDKVAAIREYSESGYKVAMVGDGVNDAPSLAAAYVSVAMGARGSDAALEQSEVVLMKDRIDNFLAAIELSGRARVVIRQNLAIALGTVVFMAGAAIFGLVPLSVGVFAHEGSTVVVCLNSLRLLFAKSNLSDHQIEQE